MIKKILIIANNNIGTGQSGGDTIFLELIKHWQKKLDITVFGAKETKHLLNRYHLSKIKFVQTDTINHHCYPTVINIFFHIIRRTFLGLLTIIKNYRLIKTYHICYSVSDFYPDFLIGLFYKIINPHGIWISSHFLFAPLPNQKNSPYRNEKIKGWLYYSSQLPITYLANKFADIIYVTSTPDTAKFPHKKVIVARGGVNIAPAIKHNKSKYKLKKIYDGIFMGRLHPQKGVVELIDIWKILCQKIPQAKLAIIGDGILRPQIIKKIKQYKLSRNIKLFGFQSGNQKNTIIKQSKVVLHPAIFDSGGMFAAEAMSFGLPGVSFDLPALTTYYPQGMIKTPIGQNQIFAKNIYSLLTNQKLYNQISKQAVMLIHNQWDWKIQAQNIYEETFN